jgi:hypothetical protein
VKCKKSDKPCERCEDNPDCPIYSERYVLVKQLRKLRSNLEETQTILKAVLEKK